MDVPPGLHAAHCLHLDEVHLPFVQRTNRRLRNLDDEPEDTDVYVLRKKKMVAVTPIDLDMTARVDLNDFEKFLRK